MKTIILYLVIVVVSLALVVSGCWLLWAVVTPDPPPEWGKGDLPEAYQKTFGNSNGARLDFVQNQVIDKHNKLIKEMAKRIIKLEAVDPNE